MKKFFIMLMILVFAAGCSGGRPTPEWTLKSFNRLEDAKKNYLEGNTRMADLSFNKAVEEIKKSGDLDVLARAYLIRMAIQTALLETVGAEEYLKVDAVQPDPANRAFYAFLTGQWSEAREALLPEQYRRLVRGLSQGPKGSMAPDVAKIEDPLSRLIAAGVCYRQGRIDEGLIQSAVETASRNGWKKALIIYLEKSRDYYREQNQRDKAATIEQRIQIITR